MPELSERIQMLKKAVLTATPITLIVLGSSVSYSHLLARDTPFDVNVVVSKNNFCLGLAILLHNLSSNCPFTMSSPDMTIVLFLKEVLSNIDDSDLDEDKKLATMWVALHLSSACLGALFATLGKIRAAIALGYLPYPVVAGFLAMIGAAIVKGAVGILLPEAEGQSNLPLALGLCLATSWILMKNIGVPTNFASVLCIVVSLSVFYSWVLVFGISGDALREEGWLMLEKAGPVNPLQIWHWDWSSVRMSHALPRPRAFTLAFVACICRALTVTGIEAAVGDTAYSIDDEMSSTGMATSFAGLVGGISMNPTSGMSILCKEGSEGDRQTGCLTAVCITTSFAFIWFSGIPLTNFLPRFLLGGLLMIMGFGMLQDWAWQICHRMKPIEIGIIYLMLVFSLFADLISGVLLGIGLALCATIFRFASLEVFKYHVSGVHFRSGEIYTDKQRAILWHRGGAIQVIGLVGFLFEGVALYLSKYLRELVRDSVNLDTLVVDFFSCQGMNDSACHYLFKVARLCESRKVKLVFCNLHPEDETLLKKWNLETEWSCFKPNLATAIGDAEHDILSKEKEPRQSCLPPTDDGSENRALEKWLGKDAAADLFTHATRRRVPAGEFLNTERGGARSRVHIAMPEHSDVQIEFSTGSAHRPTVLLRTSMGAVCPSEALVADRTCGSWRAVEKSVVLSIRIDLLRTLPYAFPAILEAGLRQQAQQSDQLASLYTLNRGGGWHGVTFDRETQDGPAASSIATLNPQRTVRVGKETSTVKTTGPAPEQCSWSGNYTEPAPEQLSWNNHKIGAVLCRDSPTSSIDYDNDGELSSPPSVEEMRNLVLNRFTNSEKSFPFGAPSAPSPQTTLQDLFSDAAPCPLKSSMASGGSLNRLMSDIPEEPDGIFRRKSKEALSSSSLARALLTSDDVS